MRTSPGALIVLLAVVSSCGPDAALQLEGASEETTESVSAELTYRAVRPPGRSIHLAEIDLCEAGIELRATGPGDGTRTVRSFAAMTGALVAINGGHSWSSVPSVSAHGGQFFGSPDQGDIGQAAFGPGVADFIHMSEGYVPRAGHQEVLSGLLTLVHDGVAQHATLPNDSYTCSVQHPRTLLGLTADRRKLLMVVVDGRAPSAGRRGMTCGEAADYMVSLGAHWALNLDGGGSTEMVVGGRIVNVPSDGQERPVPTHLAVVRTPGARGHCPVAPVQPPVPPTPTPGTCGLLTPGAALGRNEAVKSCSGRFTFVHQADGNVVLYDGGTARWSSRTAGKSSGALVMQGDGNLVLYTPGGAALWHTQTHGNAGAKLEVRDDGDVVVRSSLGAKLWSTRTAVVNPTPPTPPATPTPTAPPPPAPVAPATCGALASGVELAPGQAVSSCDGRFTLAHQGDGNVVLYQGPTVRWSTRTAGRATSALAMQADGNLVLYGATGAALWNSRTQGHAGAGLAVQSDGNLVIYEGGRALWNSGTCCH